LSDLLTLHFKIKQAVPKIPYLMQGRCMNSASKMAKIARDGKQSDWPRASIRTPAHTYVV